MSDGGIVLFNGTLQPYPDLYGFAKSSLPNNVNFSTVDMYENEPETAQNTLETTATSTKKTENVLIDGIGEDNFDSMATLDIKKQKIMDRTAEKNNQKTIAALEVDNIKHGQACVMGFGIAFLILALISAVIAFGTPDWRIYTVDPLAVDKTSPLYICNFNNPTINTCQFYSSRRRGMFTTCYTDQTLVAKFPQYILAAPWVTGDWCAWEQKYNIQTTPIIVDNNCGQDVNFNNAQLMVSINANLMRTHWLAFALAILMLFVAMIFALMSQCQIRVCGSLFSGVLTLISTILLLIGMGFFHGYTYMEEEVLRCPPYFGVLKKDIYKTLYKGTEASFGFSFFLGWLSVGLGILASAFILVGACQRRQSQGKINKAIWRLNQIAKEERAEKKFEEMESRKKRKELEKKIQKETKSKENNSKISNSRPMSFFANLLPKIPSRPKPKVNLSDSEISYDLEAKSGEARLKYENRIRKQEKKYKEWEEEEEKELKAKKKKLKEKRERELRELEEAEKEFVLAEKQKRKSGKQKHGKETHGRKDSSSDSDTSSSDSDYGIKRKNKKCSKRRHRSCDSLQKWDPKCGKVVSPAPFMQHNSCCDPYTLHLPTGMTPAYYP